MLTAAQIKAAEPRSRAYKLADAAGLHVFIAPTGRKTFRLRFRYQGAEQLLTLGHFPETSLVRARELRDDARQALRANINPAGARARAQAAAAAAIGAGTFEAAARRWHAAKLASWSPAHAAEVLSSLERHVFPELGASELVAIGAPAVLACLRKVEGSGSIETARRLCQRISAIFRRAIAEGAAELDPAAMVGGALEERPDVRHQVALLEAEQLRDAYAAIAAIGPTPPALAARLVALTGVRTGSARGARWEEFAGLDPADAGETSPPLWRIPAARMKLKRSRKSDAANDHLVPLAPAAVDLLRLARVAGGGSAFVFPSRRGGGSPIGVNAILDVHHEAGLAGRYVPHGWRAAFSTVMNERRPADRIAVDLALAHVGKGKVEAAYNRAQMLSLRRAVLDEWALVITGAANDA